MLQCESAFSLPRWLVGLVTPNKSDARWAETALAHRVVSSDRLRQSQIARFKINYFIGTSILKMADTDYHKNA